MANPFQPITVRGSGNWDANAELQALLNMRGQKIGDWVTETITEAAPTMSPGMSAEGGPATGEARTFQRRYIDTQWGRLYDATLDDYNRRVQSGNLAEGNQLGMQYDPNAPFKGMTAFTLGRYHNEHGSDQIQGNIDEHGVWQGISMDRESNADMNTWLALMATVGLAGAGAFGGAAAGEGAAAAGGIGAMDAAQLALAAASVYGATQAGEGPTTTSAEPGDPTIEGPTPPPAPPVVDYADLAKRYGGPTAKKNPTNLNPQGVANVLAASGNLLLGA